MGPHGYSTLLNAKRFFFKSDNKYQRYEGNNTHQKNKWKYIGKYIRIENPPVFFKSVKEEERGNWMSIKYHCCHLKNMDYSFTYNYSLYLPFRYIRIIKTSNLFKSSFPLWLTVCKYYRHSYYYADMLPDHIGHKYFKQ